VRPRSSDELSTGVADALVACCPSSHYVATIEQDGGAVLFNDEKVAKSEGSAHDNLKQAAYLYIFERVATWEAAARRKGVKNRWWRWRHESFLTIASTA
jgi:hypothetical protein